jgi:2-polyprenyl-3-methyl-5-hydroxy-6-metoxy-1,4-benzoquinol methylase
MTSNKATVRRRELDHDPARNPASDPSTARGLAAIATRNAARHQRNVWSRRVASWDQHGSVGLTRVTAAVVEAARVTPGTRVVDLGCGNGQVSLPLALHGAQVLAVDVSPAMIKSLQTRAQRDGVHTLHGLAMPIEELALPRESVDLVVSSYALHHLRDADKARLVGAIAHWLRPGGRVVLADMMFGRGGSSRDREIIKSKVAALAKKGPGGWWRIAKNSARYLLRVQERPVSADTWRAMFTAAGFAAVTATPIVAEACLLTAQCPERPTSRNSSP